MKPAFEEDSITVYQGDALEVLRTLPSCSVHCCVTSPPYWGLRDYGTASWECGDPGCDHNAAPGGGKVKGSTLVGTGNRDGYSADGQFRDTCGKCSATRVDSQMGLEKTPEEYIAKMVAVFAEVRRVLRDDATCWINMGDSYARQAGDDFTKKTDSGMKTGRTGKSELLFKKGNNVPPPGLKPKDLCGMPWRLAFALQADGWYLRSDIIWSKPNPMPESVTDRPTKSHEYVFLLSKSAKYYYDAEAIREPQAECTIERARYGWNGRTDDNSNGARTGSTFRRMAESGEPIGTIPENGMRNKRSVWTVATHPYSEAHFATFPPKLIIPCILAGCPAGGTVLDPFMGSGTTALVARQEHRKSIGIELNPQYIEMLRKRLSVNQGLFSEEPCLSP